MLSEALAEALLEKDFHLGMTPRKNRSVWKRILGRDKEDTWKVELWTGWDPGDFVDNPTVTFYRSGDEVGSLTVFRDRTVRADGFKESVPTDMVEKALVLLSKENEAVRRALPAIRRTLKLRDGGSGPYR